MHDEQAKSQKQKVFPIGSLRIPPPEAEGSPFPSFGERPLTSPRWSVVQCHFEQCHLYPNHEESLDKQRYVIASARPVEDFEDRCRKHDQRYVEREAGGGAGSVDREDLVGIGREWRKNQAAWFESPQP